MDKDFIDDEFEDDFDDFDEFEDEFEDDELQDEYVDDEIINQEEENKASENDSTALNQEQNAVQSEVNEENTKEKVKTFTTIISNGKEQKKYNIQDFDNPYELLLAIMEDKNVDLKTVVLSEITDEYLEYIRTTPDIDLEQASEFLAVAATLLEIKVKALLPKPEEEKDDELDPEKELLRKIEEYKIMKEAAEELHAIEDIDRFYKDPDESVNDYRYVLKQMNMDNLLNALTKMMIKLQQKTTISKERKIEKDRFTVAEKIFAIKVIMNDRNEMQFSEMFDEDFSKSEVISTFQAMLELMKIQFLKVKQTGIFEDITLIKNPDFVEGQGDQTIDNYDE